jgi:hypothetical protein
MPYRAIAPFSGISTDKRSLRRLDKYQHTSNTEHNADAPGCARMAPH